MRWARAGFLPLSLLILLAAGLFVPLPLFLERPGRAVSLAACVDVDHEEATPVEGDFLLMTISVVAGTSVDALVAAFDGDTEVVGKEMIIPRGVDAGTYFAQQRHDFVSTANIAAAVGLRAAGLGADVTGEGAIVTAIQPDTPAAEVLLAGDIITAINDSPVMMEADLRDAVASVPVGDPLVLEVQRANETIEVELVAIEAEGNPIIGVVPETVNPRVELPVAVDVASGRTGGPSAGLTIALTVYDQVLPGVDLAAGRTIAGTGTIDDSGRVGAVGGAGLKVLAGVRAGADVFLVPAENEPEARAALPADSTMEIVPVATFDQALQALEVEQGAQEDDTEAADPPTCPYRST